MGAHDIIAIGGSAGALDVLMKTTAALPRTLGASVFVVVHTAPDAGSMLPDVLSRHSGMPAVHAIDGEPIVSGRIYVAPPDHHMLVYPRHVRLSKGAKENRHRPAVDPLFRSAARAYGPRVIGVVLSGALDDGTAGLAMIKGAGGLAIVQDPDEASSAGMPKSALAHVAVDHVARTADLAQLLVDACNGTAVRTSELRPVTSLSAAPPPPRAKVDGRTVFSCPDCGGVLIEARENGVTRYTCTVGHALGEEALLGAQEEELEDALWVALRTLEERGTLLRRISTGMRGRSASTAEHFEASAREMERRAGLVREALLVGDPHVSVAPAGGRTTPPPRAARLRRTSRKPSSNGRKRRQA